MVKSPHFHPTSLQGTWVRSVFRELRYHILQGTTKNGKKKIDWDFPSDPVGKTPFPNAGGPDWALIRKLDPTGSQ